MLKERRNLDSIIQTFQAGQMVIMVDDEGRENEGDLVLAAESVTPEKINFMAKEARGLICLSLAGSYVKKLSLPMMVDSGKNRTPMETAFTVSIEAKHGVTTGISAVDRAHTILTAIDPASGPDDLVVPGHVFPIKARDGGVLERAGHTEGSVDLAKLAGKKPAAVICEIMNDDGTMARRPQLETFSEKFGIPIVSIEDLIVYRLATDSQVKEIFRQDIQTAKGQFQGIWFQSNVDQAIHFVLKKGDDFEHDCVEVRVQRQDPIYDVFASGGNFSGREGIAYALDMLASTGKGVVLYLQNPKSAPSLLGHKLPMDPRLYGIGAQILRCLGVRAMNLHVRTPRALIGLDAYGIRINQMKMMTEARKNENSQDSHYYRQISH